MRYYSRSKYGNKKTIVDGITFDSKKEADYYQELKLRKRAGDIMDFECQHTIILQEGFEYEGEKIKPIKYRADFIIYHDGLTEIVDVKGYETKEFKLKWKMLQFMYANKHGYKLTII